MKKIIILGAGKIGSAIALILSSHDDYSITLVDQFFSEHDLKKHDKNIKRIKIDINDSAAFNDLLSSQSFDAIISSLPYFCNLAVAKKAKQHNIHYFDLTEDVKTTEAIAEIARDAKTVFAPQCGLAPGMINIIANHVMESFDSLESATLRVGALPIESSNALHYALTWSTDGLINEYGNPCIAIIDGKQTLVNPLDGLEELIIDGVDYEAFYTSGGLGSSWKKYIGKIKNFHYKTLRYPGHCEKIKFLMNDLHLNEDRSVLKSILEKNIPTTHHDVVIISVSVTGYKNNIFIEENFTKKLYPTEFNNHILTAIQMSTATGICSIVDLILSEKQLNGFITHEQFTLQDILNNRFGKYYACATYSENI